MIILVLFFMSVICAIFSTSVRDNLREDVKQVYVIMWRINWKKIVVNSSVDY